MLNTMQIPHDESYLTLATPAKDDLSNFRLLAHSVYLVGRAIRYTFSPNVSRHHESALQLCRTILALITVLEVESMAAIVAVEPPRGLLNRCATLFSNVYDLF